MWYLAWNWLACSIHCWHIIALNTRVPGVRYIFIGKLFEHRPSYHLLGVLLFIQLGITSTAWAIHNFTSLSGNVAKDGEAQPSSSTGHNKERNAVVLEVGIKYGSAPL